MKRNGRALVVRIYDRAPTPAAKRCLGCRRRLAVECFGADTSAADGLNTRCRACRAGADSSMYDFMQRGGLLQRDDPRLARAPAAPGTCILRTCGQRVCATHGHLCADHAAYYRTACRECGRVLHTEISIGRGICWLCHHRAVARRAREERLGRECVGAPPHQALHQRTFDFSNLAGS